MSVKKLLAELKTNVARSGNYNPEAVTKASLGIEDDSFSAPIVAETVDKLEETVIETITDTFGMEASDISEAQLQAAKFAAVTMMDPTTFRNKKLKMPAASDDTISVPATALGIEDAISTEVVSQEAFDGQSLTNTVYYSMVANFLAARQDAFGELFYPTITINPAMAGVTMEARIINTHDNFARDKNGTPSKGKFNKVNIVKAISDPDLLGYDKTRVVPVLRDGENDSVFVKDLKYVTNVNGTNTLTAPLKIGTRVDLLGLSQTDAQLAKGNMDITDALDRRVNLTNIYFSINDDKFKFDVSNLPFSNFTYSTQDDAKDLSLSFTTESFILNTSSTKKVDGSTSSELASLAPDHKIKLRLVMHGNGNTETADIAVYASSVELVDVTNAAGVSIDPTSQVYADIKAKVDALKIEGYELEAYTTNSNLRNLGYIIGGDVTTIYYAVPNRTGISVLKPNGNVFDVENDANYISDQAAVQGLLASKHAVAAVQNYENTLRVIQENGGSGDGLKLAGIGSYLVTPTYKAGTITMSEVVDSVRSKDRDADIKAALGAKIKNAVLAMYSESNYGPALKTYNGGVEGKIQVLIGTDPEIEQYLTSGEDKLDLGDKFEVNIASTPDARMRGKIYVTFGVMGAERNTQPHPLNFGNMFWAPEMTAVVDRTTGGGNAIKQLYTAPRFLHVTHLPVLARFTVVGLDEVTNKVALNMHSV